MNGQSDSQQELELRRQVEALISTIITQPTEQFVILLAESLPGLTLEDTAATLSPLRVTAISGRKTGLTVHMQLSIMLLRNDNQLRELLQKMTVGSPEYCRVLDTVNATTRRLGLPGII